MSRLAGSPGRARLLVLGIAVVLAVVDAAAKAWAQSALSDGPARVLDGVLQFWLAENPGAAFGVLTSGGVVLGCIAIAALVWVTWYAGRVQSPLALVGLGFVAGGALGNLVDRMFREPGLLRGPVVDFIRLPRWPTFNLADVFVFVGVGLVLLALLRHSEARDGDGVGAD